MSDQSKKIVLPPYLVRRLEAFRIAKGSEQSYLLRDKLHGKTYDFDPWQFFILESLPSCDTIEKLRTAFEDRFDRTISRDEIETLFASMADQKLFEEQAATHPLLKRFFQVTFKVEDGRAVPKPFVGAGSPSAAPAPTPAAPAATAERPEELPAGVDEALGLDWRTTENMIGIFNPSAMLRVLTPILRPLWVLVYPIPFLMIAALFVSFGYSNLLIPDLYGLKADVTLFEHLLFVFVTIHVVTTLTAAVVAHNYKVRVDKWGVYLTLGFMPRWVLKMTGAERLTRKQTMWLHGSTLLARMAMYSFGALLWYTSRDSNSDLTEIGLLFMFSCGIGLLFESGNPLIKANGYFLLCAFLNEPKLRGKGYAALLSMIRGDSYRVANKKVLALYSLLSTTYVLFVVVLVSWVIVKFVFGHLDLGGSAVLIVLAFVLFMLWRNYAGLREFAQTYERQMQFERWRSRTVPVNVEEGEIKLKKPRYWPRALLICLVLAMFLPYPYDPSGAFTVFPVRRAAITTDTPGLISEVRFDGGESVKKGVVLARLQHDDFIAQLKTLDADIEQQKHVIANLKTLPKPETVKVAEQQLALAKSQVPFSVDKVDRLVKLLPSGAVTLEEVETARRQLDTDKSQVIEKEAALALAKAGPTKEEIAAAESRLVSLQEQRQGIAEKIERMTMRMPFDGNILTLHLLDKVNSYLPAGQAFAEVENTGSVTAQIQIIESDIQYVKLGQTVRARPSSYFYDEFEGKVTNIDRNVTPRSFGNVVLVIATFENKDALLKTGMTGEAKVAAVSMPVWKAFTHSITRFIRLQVWSWIP